MAEAAGLPEYTLRRSARARRIRLAVSASAGLVITLPPGATSADAERALVSRAHWARLHLAAVAERRAALRAHPRDLIPQAVELPATGESRAVVLRPEPLARVRARPQGGAHLELAGPVGDARACLEALRRWRDAVARARLPAMLEELSGEVGIGYARVSVRGQRTRWGSYSASGTISLNRNLIFLPPELVRYVMLHELAHVRVPAHSPRFWALLASLCPDAPELRRRMRTAGDFVPPWADNHQEPADSSACD